MKTITLGAALALSLLTLPAMASGSHSVRGHTTKNGTYVQPHHATNPDNTKSNNYSHQGNVNPYNGKVGSKSD